MLTWKMLSAGPRVVAHRGASRLAPENTLAAFERAVRLGAEAIELDVHLSRDGEVVVIHDHRLERTTDGRGSVHGLTLAELKRLSAGSWFHKRYSSQRIPTLGEVMDCVGEKICLNVEVKAPPGGEYPPRIVERCIELAQSRAAEERILISSFHAGYLKRAASLSGTIRTGLLYHPMLHRRQRPVALALSLGASYLILSGVLLRKRIVLEAHARGLGVGEYTVNSRFRMLRSVRYGVDILMSDECVRALRVLASYHKKSPLGKGA